MKIKLIYLAAGNSRRFGKNGENKLFYELDGKPMYRHLLDRLLHICRRHPNWELILVTQYPEIADQVKKLPLITVMSENSYKGASYSIKAGIRAAEDADAYAFFVADQPYFSEKSAENFLEKMERDAKMVPGCVTWKGEEGNPVWFPVKYAEELLLLEGDAGGRKVFRRYQEQAIFYEVTEARELEDLDYAPQKKESFRVYRMENGNWIGGDSLTEALHLTDKKDIRIAAVGAGGKTSLLKQLAKEYKRENKKPVIVTTTHMKKENVPFFTTEERIEKILEVREVEGMVIAGADAGNERIKSLPDPVMREIWELDAPVLAEADGARMLPLKIPGDHEPVIPEETDTVLLVYGLDAVGKKLREVCFRSGLAAALLGKSQDETVSAEDIVSLAVAPEGGKKGILPEMNVWIVLNKADSEPRLEMAKKIAKCLEMEYEKKVLITSFR